MVFGIAAGIAMLAVLLFATPVWAHIRCCGADPLCILVGLYWGKIPLWVWQARKVTQSALQSDVRILFLPRKRMLPRFRRAKKENGKKKAGFLPITSLRSLRIDASIPWDEGWETLQLFFAQRLAALMAGIELRRKETQTNFQIRIVPPGEKTVFAIDVVLKLQWWSTLIQIGRKAVKKE